MNEITNGLSKRNLQRELKRMQKYKVLASKEEVDAVVQGLPLFHCMRQNNIMQIIKDGEIKVKNLIEQAETTNNSTDFLQGFDKHLSLSIGQPWTEYGPYSFVFGLNNLSEDALFFDEDPWIHGSQKLSECVLIKQDFITLIREMISKKVKYLTKKRIYQSQMTKDLHKLIRINLKGWEAKEVVPLKIMDSEDFMIFTRVDAFIYSVTRQLWSWTGLILFIAVLIILKFVNWVIFI